MDVSGECILCHILEDVIVFCPGGLHFLFSFIVKIVSHGVDDWF